MSFAANKPCVFAVLTVLLVLTPAISRAELIRVEITKRVDVLAGKAFGDCRSVRETSREGVLRG